MTQETYKIFMLILSATGQTGMMVFFFRFIQSYIGASAWSNALHKRSRFGNKA